MLELVGWHRTSDEVALDLVGAEFLERVELLVGLGEQRVVLSQAQLRRPAGSRSADQSRRDVARDVALRLEQT